MGKSVKLSDDLVSEARRAGEAAGRSVAGQIEHWAKLGRAVESAAGGGRVKPRTQARSLSELLAEVETAAGRKRLEAHLKSGPFPHFEAGPGRRGLVVRVDENGKRTTGRFVNRAFRRSD